jgi:hypothetical protein
MDKVTNFPHFHAIQLVLGKPESNLTLLNAMKTTLHTSICIYDYCLCEWVVKDKWFWSFKEWRICFLYTCEPYIFGICHTLLWLWYNYSSHVCHMPNHLDFYFFCVIQVDFITTPSNKEKEKNLFLDVNCVEWVKSQLILLKPNLIF